MPVDFTWSDDNPEWGGSPINFNTTTTAQNNLGSVPQIAQLTNLINSINQTAQQTANAGRIPGGAGLERTSSANIGRALTGQLDPSVIAQIGQRAAERGVMTGSPTGPGSSAAYLRALGLNALDLMNTGQNWLSAATSRNPAAPLFNPSEMFLTPYQAANLDLERQRIGLMNRGGGGGGGGRYAAPEETPTGGGVAMNWADLFSGDNRGLTPLGSRVPIGTGTDTSNIILSGGGDQPTGYYNPATNTTDLFNPDYFGIY